MNKEQFLQVEKTLRKVFSGSKTEFTEMMDDRLLRGEGMFVVTANPETLSLSRDKAFGQLLQDPDAVLTADGIGVMKMAACLGIAIPERCPGVDLVSHLLAVADHKQLRLAILGSAPEVLELFQRKLAEDFPGINVVYACDGYQPDKKASMEAIIKEKPDILLTALGIPAQEKLIYEFWPRLKQTICIGVGGSLDVLSGYKKRAPVFFRKLGIEWLYRIVSEPKRLKRFWRNNLMFYLDFKLSCRRFGGKS